MNCLYLHLEVSYQGHLFVNKKDKMALNVILMFLVCGAHLRVNHYMVITKYVTLDVNFLFCTTCDAPRRVVLQYGRFLGWVRRM